MYKRQVENRHLEDQILEVRVPLQDVVELKNGVQKVSQKKMFPGYVLIHMIMNDDTWYVVRNTRGVTGFVAVSYTHLDVYKRQGMATVIHFGYPVFVLLGSLIFLRRRVPKLKIVCVGLCMIGIFLSYAGSGGEAKPMGFVFALISGMTYAFYILYLEVGGLQGIDVYKRQHRSRESQIPCFQTRSIRRKQRHNCGYQSKLVRRQGNQFTQHSKKL